AECPGAVVEYESAGRQVVGEGIVDDITRTKAGGEQRAGTVPRVGSLTLRLKDRPRGQKNATKAARLTRRKAPERWFFGLRCHQFGFAQHRKARQCLTRVNRLRINACEMSAPAGRRVDRMAQQVRQAAEQIPFPLLGSARFQTVEVLAGHVVALGPTGPLLAQKGFRMAGYDSQRLRRL